MSDDKNSQQVIPDSAADTGGAASPRKPSKRPKPVWVKVLRAMLWTILAVVVLVLVVITVAVSYLKPERLTPLVEKYANEYVDADVNIGRVEISFWSTFPKFILDVRDLTVNSHAFDSLAPEIRKDLPQYADSLISVRHFNGAVNIPHILAGKIYLYDITFEHPAVNIVQATPESSNLDIFPESEEKNEDSPLLIPDIAIGTFSIQSGMPVRYFSRPDSLDIAVNFSTTSLEGNGAPIYNVDIAGLTSASLPAFSIRNLSFGADGKITWDHHKPMMVALSDFTLSAGKVSTVVSTDIDMTDGFRVNAFDFLLPQTPVADIIDLIPEDMQGELAKITTDLKIGMNGRLTAPFDPAHDSIPSFTLSLNVPEGSGRYEQLILTRFALDAKADIDGKDLDGSTVELSRLLAIGKGVGFELNGVFKDLMSDPSAEGSFKGGIEIDRLPSKLLEKLPFKIDGSLRADSRFAFRRSYFDKKNFHRIRLTGDATLRDFTLSMPELPADLYTDNVELKLGTNSSFTRGEVHVDSLLTASLKIDSISASVTGMLLQATGVKMGVGCQNTASSVDTTLINPIGGRIVADRILFKSTEDSLRVRLRKPTVGATIRRYKGEETKPQLHLDIATEGAFYADRVNRALLRKALLFVTANPTDFSQTPRKSRLADSIANAHPELSQDSIRTLVALERRARRAAMMTADSAAVADGEIIDIGVDNSMRRMLRRWEARGVLKAERMRVFTPYFPLRNTLSDFNMRFNSDSIIISDTKMRAGKTSLVMNGNVSNLTKALTSVRHTQPLRMEFNLSGDTIEINEIAAAAFAGAAFAERDSLKTYVAPDTENETELQTAVSTTGDSLAILVVPSNVEAKVHIAAHDIFYSNLKFTDFTGDMNVLGGAINLESMNARTTVGSINLNALYSAPASTDASFAFGMKLNDFHIGQFLDLVPAIDSLMPLLYDIDGIINADIAATSRIDEGMNIDIPSLKAAVKLSGDSLVLVDPETFRKVGKWLMFKNKNRNVIDSMNVEMIVQNSQLELFPFIFNLDRYKLGVMGSNDMAMNLNYHVAVLKSPIPFKFGINISGTMDDMKIRLGGAKFNEKNMPRSVAIADTTRINLVKEIGNIFRRGVRGARMSSMRFGNLPIDAASGFPDVKADTISHTDSLYFMKEGLIARPDTVPAAVTDTPQKKKSRKKK
ncbi:AsmA-like C-terminal region-containing protein [uncultured Duncaniella sp.]|uniref:AsmA-like C-terminal region-containing protein n=2 Tax=uncultured Duncaniella sp. TaxID=2768039 RepID=UPI00260ADB51|nr:AsmA-like C-terminal region-containing protein [uncultured Duncaniella sp.]